MDNKLGKLDVSDDCPAPPSLPPQPFFVCLPGSPRLPAPAQRGSLGPGSPDASRGDLPLGELMGRSEGLLPGVTAGRVLVVTRTEGAALKECTGRRLLPGAPAFCCCVGFSPTHHPPFFCCHFHYSFSFQPLSVSPVGNNGVWIYGLPGATFFWGGLRG